MIVGPIVGILIILVLVLVFKDSGNGGSEPDKTPVKTPEQIAADKERAEEARKRKAEEAREQRELQLMGSYNKRALKCKTADDYVKLGREAYRDKLEALGKGYYAQALALDPDSVGAHRGLRHTKFDCSRYLKEFDMLDFGGIDDRLKEYKAHEGQWLPAPKFEETKAKWNEELPELLALVEERENNPYEQKTQAYEKQLKGKPFFDDIARLNGYKLIKTAEPVALLVQESLDRDEGHFEAIGKRYTTALLALDKHMRENYFDEFGFEKREGFAAYFLWVLNSHGAYDNYHRIGKNTFGLSDSTWAHYNHGERVAITFLSVEKHERITDFVFHALLHEMVHYYQDAYAPYGIRGMSSFWVIEGMADWISSIGSLEGKSKIPKGPFFFEQKNADRTNEFLHMIKKLNGSWPIPLVALLEIQNGIALNSAIEAAIADEPDIAAMGSKADVMSTLTSWTYGFGVCMCYYLNKEYPKEFRRYLKLDLEGDGDTDAFKRIFKIQNLNKFANDLVEYYE